jgi:hypothetical protein
VGQEHESVDLPLRNQGKQQGGIPATRELTCFWEIAKAIRDADVGIILAASCDTSDLQLISETLLFVIHLLECLRQRTSFLDFFLLLTCSDCDVLSKVLQIFVLLVKLGPEFVRPYLLSEWVSGIINTIVPANINLQFVRNTSNGMFIGRLSGSDPAFSDGPFLH